MRLRDSPFCMSLPDAASLEAFSLAELWEAVGRLVGEVRRLYSDNAALRSGAEAQQEPCCMDLGCGRSYPSPAGSQAMRTEIGRPRSSMRLSAWTSTSTTVARRSSVRERSPSPITCLNLAMAASARARFV